MGREIRRVPANWEHPMQGASYRPMFEGGEEAYRERYQEWMEEREEYGDNGDPYEPEDFMPDGDWWQLFETVSEGTPITPPFPTSEALVDYLVEHGDFWRHRWTREQAEAIVAHGYAPSFVMIKSDHDVRFMNSAQAAEWISKK